MTIVGIIAVVVVGVLLAAVVVWCCAKAVFWTIDVSASLTNAECRLRELKETLWTLDKNIDKRAPYGMKAEVDGLRQLVRKHLKD